MSVINQLARPKGVKFDCEICGKQATLICTGCKVTYYCTKDHQNVDWKGIHSQICQDVIVVRNPPPAIGSEEERSKRDTDIRNLQIALIELTKETAQRFLIQSKYDLAVPGALQCLKFSISVYGNSSIELVLPYLLLAEANLGLGRLKIAEEFLSLANWIILKLPDCGSTLKSRLHRNFGRLYASQDMYAEALRSLASDVYFSSLEAGPEHISTAASYYHMANVFHSQSKNDQALAFFDKVEAIWYKFLTEIAETRTVVLTEVQSEEAVEILRHILEFRQKFMGPDHIACAQTLYTLALLHRFTQDLGVALEYLRKALPVFESIYGVDHSSCQTISAIQRELSNQIQAATLKSSHSDSRSSLHLNAISS
eukprot:GILI01001269.1.p1 GENE.GILI01001269.1~~GILI01001269.1.p1  ORF type:complete len:369 (+),score=64.79 GILI01001269.1:77-1183(+)